ncbi:MAG: glycosyltransferase family 2 protein [bacterium]|nr:glycosyltransferase family 2 protein [bacterium]
MQKLPELSVFFPAYNEQANIENTVLSAVAVCEKLTNKYEIIIVNDGSADNTLIIANKLAFNNSNISVISHNPNIGYGGALKSGIYKAKYDYIAFTDSDGQFDFSQLSSFIPYLNDYPVVIGYRKHRVEGVLRKLNAKGLKFAALILFHLKFKDIDCAFKVFKKSVIDTIPRLSSDGALISTEFLYKVKKANIKIKEIPVNHYPRAGGKPTGANFKVLKKAFIELLTLWINLR